MGKEQITVKWPEAAQVLTDYGFKLDCIGGISFDGVHKDDAEALFNFMKKRLANRQKLGEATKRV